MKKLFAIMVLTSLMLFSLAGMAFAENAVSQMATSMGGQHVAKCAQMMDKGVSECAQMAECEHSM